MTHFETHLVYPAETQRSPADCRRVLDRLRRLGVSLDALEGGVVAVNGPAEWFSEENLKHLCELCDSLWSFLAAGRSPKQTSTGRSYSDSDKTTAPASNLQGLRVVAHGDLWSMVLPSGRIVATGLEEADADAIVVAVNSVSPTGGRHD